MGVEVITALAWTAQTALLSNYANTHFLRLFASPIGHNLTRFSGCVLISLFGGYVLRLKKATVPHHMFVEKMKIMLVPAICMICMNLSNSYGLQFSGVTLTYVVKSTIPVWTVLWSLSQGERYPLMVVPALLMCCMGVGLASFADFEFNILGFLAALFSTLAQTAFNILSKIYVEKSGLSSTEGFFVSTCICYFVLQTLFYAEMLVNPHAEDVFGPSYIALQAGNYWPALVLFLTTFSYFTEYQLNFALVGMVSTLTFSISDIVRRLATISLNSFIFDKELTPMNIAGIAIALGGALLYSLIVNQDALKRMGDKKKGASTSKKSRSASPAPLKKGAKQTSTKKSRSRSRSRSPPKEETSPVERSADILDKFIDAVGELGVLALVVAGAAAYVGVYGVPEEKGMVFCALAMGVGKGGVPGASTLASAFFALMAPAGRVNLMMAIVVPITMLCDCAVGLTYMHDALWKVAMKMVVWTGFGILAGMQINQFMSDDLTRRFIGVLFLGVVASMIYDRVVVSDKQSKKELAAKKDFLFSVKVLAPCGLIGGIASYITNNMGPMLNVYLLALDLDKYALVGTRSAIFISVNSVKLVMRVYNGDLPYEMMPAAFALGGVGVIGVILAKIWLKNASPALFKFVYERVTFGVVSVTGALLVCGWDLKSLVKVCWETVAPHVNKLLTSDTLAATVTTTIAAAAETAANA
eukprot:GEMP01007542.1.p1 GENE.GEMP01007542.1~~GEMP01007542.1.p1  ORF type:complete len:699 (+),score=154.69 GEMP01007542.1:56-2152(+)